MSDVQFIAALFGSLVTGGAAVAVAVLTGIVKLKKRTPETLTHRCRLCQLDVYTFIKVDKKQTPPLCPYLDASDFKSCRYTPQESTAVAMQKVNEGRCYIALFTEKHDLVQ